MELARKFWVWYYSRKYRREAAKSDYVTPQDNLAGVERVMKAREISDLVLPPVDRLNHECEIVAKACNAESAVMTVITEDSQTIKAGYGLSKQDERMVGSPVPIQYSICVFVVSRQSPLVIPDTAKSEVKSCLAVPNIGSYIGVPLYYEGYVIGALAAYNQKRAQWTTAHLEVMRLASEHITSLIEFRAI